MDFAGFLFSGLDFLLVIRDPRRQMYDLQLTHSMLDRTCLLQYHVIQCRFALRAEERILHDPSSPAHAIPSKAAGKADMCRAGQVHVSWFGKRRLALVHFYGFIVKMSYSSEQK